MAFEQQLERLAEEYAGKGYDISVRPSPEQLPSFAKDFKVEIVGKRGAGGVLVSVKKTRSELEADKELPRYAKITIKHPEWRYDFAILEAEDSEAREVRGAQELPDEDIGRMLDDAEQLLHSGVVRPALITAWAALEAVMRRRLRSLGESVQWGAIPRQLLNELFSAGVVSFEEFPELERAYRLRNEVVHGFASPNLDAEIVRFVIKSARRLQQESHSAMASA